MYYHLLAVLLERLTCVRCHRLIEPHEPIVVVSIGAIEKWDDPEHAAQRLEWAAGRWHYRCAPACVKKYTAGVWH
jgi:hypothetical protein